METKELAKQLGISHQFCNRLKKRGMPTHSLQAAKDWRGRNLNLVQTKEWRIDGNGGTKRRPVILPPDYFQDDTDLEHSFKDLNNDLEAEVLMHVIPSIWFEQPGWLGSALINTGVKITAEQLLEVQGLLFSIYMDEITEYLQEDDDIKFYVGPVLRAKPGDDIYSSLIERLDQILNKKASPRKL